MRRAADHILGHGSVQGGEALLCPGVMPTGTPEDRAPAPLQAPDPPRLRVLLAIWPKCFSLAHGKQGEDRDSLFQDQTFASCSCQTRQREKRVRPSLITHPRLVLLLAFAHPFPPSACRGHRAQHPSRCLPRPADGAACPLPCSG